MNLDMVNNWQEINLNKVCNIYQPKTITSKDISTSGLYKVFGANGVIGYFDKYNHEEPEVLMTCRGATCGTINLSESKSWITGNAMVIQPRNVDYLNKMYLYYFLQYINPKSLISGSAQPQITRQAFVNIKIPIPVFEVQQKIALILSTVDEEIQKTDQIIEKTEKLKKGLMNELLTKGIGHTKFKKTSFGNIPFDWKIESLGEILDKIIDHRGLTPKKLGSDWSPDGIPAISAMHVKGGKIINKETIRFVDENLYKKWMKEDLNEGDVLLTSEAPFGELYIVNKNEKFCLSQRLFGLRAKNYLDSMYFYYFLSSDMGQQQMSNRATGSTAKGIRQTELLKIQVLIPPKEEQQKISNVILNLDEKLNLEKELFGKLNKIKNGLLNDIFNQKVGVDNV